MINIKDLTSEELDIFTAFLMNFNSKEDCSSSYIFDYIQKNIIGYTVMSHDSCLDNLLSLQKKNILSYVGEDENGEHCFKLDCNFLST